jgi:2'-5' RNA ligase
MVPGDRLVVILLQPLPAGATFKSWPLHITIVPWFRTELPTEDVAAQLEDVLRAITPFEAVVGTTAQFGRGGRKTVELIDTPSPLLALERLTRRYLKRQQSWIVDETTRMKRPYSPHVTRQGEIRAQVGETIYVTQPSIIEQHGDHKEVVGLVDLASNVDNKTS